MSKKKSLGSSPIGYSSLGDESFDFIPNIGVSKPEQEAESDNETDSAAEAENRQDTQNEAKGRFNLPPIAKATPTKKQEKAYLVPEAKTQTESKKTAESEPPIESKAEVKKTGPGDRKEKNKAESKNGEEVQLQDIIQTEKDRETTKKKIASYSLEEHLVERVRAMGDDRNSYYSTVVGNAIRFWLKLNGY